MRSFSNDLPNANKDRDAQIMILIDRARKDARNAFVMSMVAFCAAVVAILVAIFV